MLASKMWSAGLRSPMTGLINSFRSVLVLSANNLSTKSESEPISTVVDTNKTQSSIQTNEGVIEKVNSQLEQQNEGRLFAVVHLCGKQYKVTTGDIFLLDGYFPPTIGDKIRLDKVLAAGGNDFSLLGRPLLQPGLVDVQATIIEKTLSHTRIHFKKKRRKQFTRFNFQRAHNTMVMINSITVAGRVNESVDNSKPIQLY